jgi:hypothetical protein
MEEMEAEVIADSTRESWDDSDDKSGREGASE